MTQTIITHFDGKVLIPEEPIELPIGKKILIKIEAIEEEKPRFASLLQFAADLPDAPTDLSIQHDHYLTGSPKK